jgi:hypothetical protein
MLCQRFLELRLVDAINLTIAPVRSWGGSAFSEGSSEKSCVPTPVPWKSPRPIAPRFPQSTIEILLTFSTVSVRLDFMAQERRVPKSVGEQRRLRAIASPLRIELIGALRTLGRASIRELAAELDRPADALYHHVRLLVRADLVAECERRKKGRRIEAVYTLTESRIAARLDPSSPQSKLGVIRAGTAAIRLAAREFAAAIESDQVLCTNGLPNARASHQRTWLADEGVQKLQRLFGQIERLLLKQNRQKQGRRYSLTIVLAPLRKKRTRHGSS